MAAKLWLMALTAFDVPRVEAALFWAPPMTV
jgi:hypothetical protein